MVVEEGLLQAQEPRDYSKKTQRGPPPSPVRKCSEAAAISAKNLAVLDALFAMADGNDGLVDYNEFMKYVIEAEGPKLAKWDDKCYEPVWESAEYKNLTKREAENMDQPRSSYRTI